MVGLVSVGCCYMKLTGGGGEEEEGEGEEAEGEGEEAEGEEEEKEEEEEEEEENGERARGGERVEEEGKGDDQEGREEGEESGGKVRGGEKAKAEERRKGEEEGGEEEGRREGEVGANEGRKAGKREVVEGYPMSQFLRKQCVHKLSYEAKELSCHSIAAYSKRLTGDGKPAKFSMSDSNHLISSPSGDFEHLKVHCHRAAVEILLRKVGHLTVM